MRGVRPAPAMALAAAVLAAGCLGLGSDLLSATCTGPVGDDPTKSPRILPTFGRNPPPRTSSFRPTRGRLGTPSSSPRPTARWTSRSATRTVGRPSWFRSAPTARRRGYTGSASCPWARAARPSSPSTDPPNPTRRTGASRFPSGTSPPSWSGPRSAASPSPLRASAFTRPASGRTGPSSTRTRPR